MNAGRRVVKPKCVHKAAAYIAFTECLAVTLRKPEKRLICAFCHVALKLSFADGVYSFRVMYSYAGSDASLSSHPDIAWDKVII